MFANLSFSSMPGQLALAYSCGATAIFAAGRCARCYRRHWAYQRLFNGQREALNRDRVCLVCGATHDLMKREPLPHTTTCSKSCRARDGRLLAMPSHSNKCCDRWARNARSVLINICSVRAQLFADYNQSVDTLQKLTTG